MTSKGDLIFVGLSEECIPEVMQDVGIGPHEMKPRREIDCCPKEA
jgi:hypothetical protein